MADRPISQSNRAVLELRDLVVGGTLKPGARVYEVALAEMFGLSRTPVREALTRLEQEGLLEKVPTGGFVVRGFSYADVVDAIELRGTLEGLAARLAAERGADVGQMLDVVAELDKVLDAGPEAMEFPAYADLNDRFHAQLAALSGSQVVRREIERASQLGFASPSAFVVGQGDVLAFRRSLSVAQSQHRALVEAIGAREGARAEAIAREHARLARRNLEYVMFEDRQLIGRVPALSLVDAQRGAA
ncbi:MAG: GntR family transcriptional regulator [Paracoccaceae bacterium]|nr:GntR family transcriptional regulator [Paracoccaceae bacterium]